ncbi:MAG TPA: nucleotidyltransferase family protein [Thermoanaerobaculia bacterium]|nr:nucleotidyltransferase family protein [Thermoanaerobaculia bacterium]
MERPDLIPDSHRSERTFLLHLLGAEPVDVDAANAIDPQAFLTITPRTLYPWVHWRLKQAGDGVAALRALFAESYRENALRHLRRMADLRHIDGALQAVNVPYLLLKGPVLAATVYEDPATRTMTDLDLLIRDADFARAMSALAEIGYVVPADFAGVTMQAGDAPPLFNGQPGSPVLEMHAMLDSAPDDPATVDEVWATARVVELGHGLRVPALAPAEFFAHVVTHVSRHHRFEGELRSLLDVALLLRSKADLDWASLKEEWTRRRIVMWVELTLSLANILLGAPLPKAFSDAAPPPEALMLAAEQLWVDKDKRVSGKITQLFTGSAAAPVHAHAAGAMVPMPSGRAGMRLRARRQWQMVRRNFSQLLDGTLRPRTVARDVTLFRNRERLFTLLESSERRPR